MAPVKPWLAHYDPTFHRASRRTRQDSLDYLAD
jgi:hypothetical protein